MNTDGQLRVAHLILGYKPISSSFQAPKCVIKSNSPRLYRISVAVPGFLLPEGVPIPGGTLIIEPIHADMLATETIFEGIPKVSLQSQQLTGVATSSHPTNIEEEEVVEVPDSEDEFEVFNQALSPDTSTPNLGPPSSSTLDEMGIQRKPKSSLLDLIESQPGRDAPVKAAQTKPPTPLPALPFQHGSADLKRKRESKGKEVMDASKSHPLKRTRLRGRLSKPSWGRGVSRGEVTFRPSLLPGFPCQCWMGPLC